jgi:hypothetical protein
MRSHHHRSPCCPQTAEEVLAEACTGLAELDEAQRAEAARVARDLAKASGVSEAYAARALVAVLNARVQP